MRKELELAQGSEDWLEWRRSKRMASETPAVMGLSPYQSPNDVRKAKRGVKAFENNAMRIGTELEPVARAKYEELYEVMRPAVYEDGDYGASVDGINLDGDKIIEIKVPYSEDAERIKLAKDGKLSPYDLAQVQHQIMVTGVASADFVVYDRFSDSIHVVEVEPNPAFWSEIVTAWDSFWETLSERSDRSWVDAALAFKLAKVDYDKAEAELATKKKALVDLLEGDFNVGAGVAVQKVVAQGQVDWKKVQGLYLKGIDVDQYRKKGTTSYRVSEVEL